MKKPKLLYASPFAPMQSGISDYSELLVYGLRDHYDITLLIDNYNLSNKKLYDDFTVLKFKKNLDCSRYDHVIYNIGNNPYFHSYIYGLAVQHPGLVILHDFVLYFLFVGYYGRQKNLYAKIFEQEGARGIHLLKRCIKKNPDLLECKEIAPMLPLNKEILSRSAGIVVHSEFTKKLVVAVHPEAQVYKLNMVSMASLPPHDRTDYLKTRYGIGDDAIVIGSFGFIVNTKLNHIVCDVVKDLSQSLGIDVYYIMVGEGDYVNYELGRNVIKTGYIARYDYEAILERCDIVANLRYPSMGETSISLIHAMGKGKPCIVSKDAWFLELPDDTVIKLDVHTMKQSLMDALFRLLHNRSEMAYYGVRARAYVAKEHSPEIIAASLNRILQQSVSRR
jgi:glycosyltransferase involved in cell wall biosynthesis